MIPASPVRSRTLFSTAAAVALGLQFAPWPSTLQAQGKAPAPLIVQTQARPISQQKRELRRYNNSQLVAPPAPPAAPAQQPAQQRASVPQYPKTEVQKELEKLYEQNGRAVPEMVDPRNSPPAGDQAAATAPGAAQPAQQYAQPAQQYAPPTQQYAQQAQPVSAPKKRGLLSKWFGKEDGPTQPPAEQPYVPPVSTLPTTPPAMVTGQPLAPATGLPNYSQLFSGENSAAQQPPQQMAQQPATQLPLLQAPPQQQPLVQAAPAQPSKQYQPYVVPAPQSQAPALHSPSQSQPPVTVSTPTNDGFEAPLFVETPPTAPSNGLPQIDFNAPLEDPVADTVDLGNSAPLTKSAEPVKPVDPFSDDALFPGATTPVTTATPPRTVAPEVKTETSVAVEAAPVEPAPPAVEEAPADENPYSGLTLDADPFSKPADLKVTVVKPKEIPAVPVEPEEPQPEPKAETAETSPPALMVPPSEEVAGADEPPLVVDPAEVTPRAAPVARSGNERTRAKQEMIAARKGLRGLKGFCPVVLREDRDLVDAHSQFRAVYNSKTYYLSSSEAVSAFQSDPAKYAPAARGCDVIHQAITGEEFEGSLDFAVWYKGRLYLFSSAETMDTFVSAPSSHATLD